MRLLKVNINSIDITTSRIILITFVFAIIVLPPIKFDSNTMHIKTLINLKKYVNSKTKFYFRVSIES